MTKSPLADSPHTSGSKGEKYIVDKVKCPNCGRKLMKLPASFPLFDVQCKGCLFRAQVKSVGRPPSPSIQIFGSGWDMFEKNRKAGHLLPPVILNFHWKQEGKRQRRVVFFPFLTKKNVREHKQRRKGGYRQFNYVGLFEKNVPSMILYPPSCE